MGREYNPCNGCAVSRGHRVPGPWQAGRGFCDRGRGMIDLNTVGAHPERDPDGRWRVRLGIHLPGITPDRDYRLRARVIHEHDQFIRSIPPRDFELTWLEGSPYDLWQVSLVLSPVPGTAFGLEGRYLYRYELLRAGRPVVFWFSDPFGRETGQGTRSAFRIGPGAGPFAWNDGAFRVPRVDDMVVYELHVGEFNRSFEGVRRQLDYLQGLGVNVLELMPFTNVKEEVEWGYTPTGYFAPDERYGGADGLRRLVDDCHQRDMAVVLDAVYAHAHPEFAYNLVYAATGEPNPMMGVFQGEFFPGRPGTDYSKAFTRDYFFTLNRYWLESFHLDGFRYDYVPGMYDGPTGQGYADLTYRTYRFSRALNRFADPAGFSRIIQCAEHLPDPRGILRNTYSSCCWQNALMDKATDTARWRYVDPGLAFLLDPEFIGYPGRYENPTAGDGFPVAPFQYIESHDNPRFLTRIAPGGLTDLLGEAFGDRSQFYRMQPYVIALYTGKGIPMLWQGQEIGENWGIPGAGLGRNLFERPVHWEYFYDPYGRALVRLHRIMGELRRSQPALSSRGILFYYNDPDHYRRQVIVFHREAPDQAAGAPLMVFINFSDEDRAVQAPFPAAGRWVEQIDRDEAVPRPEVRVPAAGERHSVVVPSHYGCVYARVP